MKTFPRETVLREIEAVLAPFIGAGLARASAITQADKIGLSEVVTFNELEELLDRLRRGLSVFVGKDKASVLMDEIRQRVTKEARP